MVDACPKCGCTKIENDECLHCGVFVSKYLAYLARRAAAEAGAGAAGVGTPARSRGDRGFLDLVADAAVDLGGAAIEAGGAVLDAAGDVIPSIDP